MPIITFEGGQMDKEQKRKLAKNLTEAAHESLGIPREAFTILLKENSFDNISIGGKLFSDSDDK